MDKINKKEWKIGEQMELMWRNIFLLLVELLSGVYSNKHMSINWIIVLIYLIRIYK